MTQSKSRFRLSHEQKVAICDMHLMDPKMTQAQLGGWAKEKFGLEKDLSQKTISNILNNSEKSYAHVANGNGEGKSSKKNKMPELDKDIENFIAEMNKKNAPVNRATVILFAQTVARKKYKMHELPEKERITFSDGWLTKLFKRIGVKSRHLYGENSSVDLTEENIVAQLKDIKKILSTYKDEDILNFDETGLYYEQQPTRTICKTPMGGVKKSKNRFTVGLLTNSDGSYKGHPVVIGKRKTPRGASKRPVLYSKTAIGQSHHIDYYQNDSAWMTTEIFYKYMKRLNASFAYKNRHVAILVDNASVHKIKEELSHIKLVFLPANTTSKLQSLDAGKYGLYDILYRLYLLFMFLLKALLQTSRLILDGTNTSELSEFTSPQLPKMIFRLIEWTKWKPCIFSQMHG